MRVTSTDGLFIIFVCVALPWDYLLSKQQFCFSMELSSVKTAILLFSGTVFFLNSNCFPIQRLRSKQRFRFSMGLSCLKTAILLFSGTVLFCFNRELSSFKTATFLPMELSSVKTVGNKPTSRERWKVPEIAIIIFCTWYISENNGYLRTTALD